jgi:hypothetical protein
MTETYLPEDFIEINSNTPKGHKGQLASHKRYSDLEQDTGFNTDVDKSDDNRRHVGKHLHQTATLPSASLSRKGELLKHPVKRMTRKKTHASIMTLKALRRKVPISLSGDSSDYARTKKDDSNTRNNESSDMLGGDSHEHNKKKASKASKQDQSKTIDLRKVQKNMTGSKDKRVFRKEVEKRREVVVKDKKVC